MTLTPEAIIRLGVEMREAQKEPRRLWSAKFKRELDRRQNIAEIAFDAAASEYLAQIEREK